MHGLRSAGIAARILRRAATELHYSFNAIVEGLSHALQFMLATDLWEDLEGSISMWRFLSADHVKWLSDLIERKGKWHLLLSAFLR